MVRPKKLRTAGWAILALLVGTAVVAVALQSWSVGAVVALVLLGANAALLFDQRVHQARAVQITRAVHRDQRHTAATLSTLSKKAGAWSETAELVREHDRRVLGVIESERIKHEELAEEVTRNLTALINGPSKSDTDPTSIRG